MFEKVFDWTEFVALQQLSAMCLKTAQGPILRKANKLVCEMSWFVDINDLLQHLFGLHEKFITVMTIILKNLKVIYVKANTSIGELNSGLNR